ncbi:allophanate hydrolase [Paenibacillus sp. MWE-103]|uniref:Allophanate hydrolase n=1 Tax=Paenibacillus artemisiicola TaxID=1172618 RepID=A0ABS3WCA9_9BACL|nr:allophanate hydrolase [Paenibacillus artemisiicola]MBO7745950.1 allophanate hydrolase [Paenibacillus artemisiicola]
MRRANEKWPEHLTVSWLKERYADGTITPVEVAEEIVRRAERDADMRIWITPPAMERIAPHLKRLEGTDPGSLPLWGVPFAVKDNIDVAGLPTTAACPDFAFEPDASAVVVRRLIDAGAIPVGKTNLDQFATGLVGTRSPYGETHNALRPELISGGSSSGSAVAVARGQAAFALGTDTAGSGRVPAALNGLVGYKPSLGAWPTKGVLPACASLDCVTVFAHGLDDALAVDAAARGPEAADPWSKAIPAPRRGRLPSAVCLPEETPAFYGPFAAEYRAAWADAVSAAQAMNLPIVKADLALFAEAAAILYDGPLVAERWADLGDFVTSHPGAAHPVTERVLRTGASPAYTAAAAFRAAHRLQALKLEARGLLADAVLLLPTCGGTWTRDEVRRDPISTNGDMGRYTNHCNLLDLCAVAVPAGEVRERTPFGVTFFATADNESLIVGAAAAFEAARGALAESAGRIEAVASREAAAPRAVETIAPPEAAKPATTLVAVCGLHMRGFPLEPQMRACGAVFVREAKSAPKYRLVKLPTVPAKPGMIKVETGGAAVALEVWEMPLAAFGGFVASIPAPLGIGKVELSDGAEVPGFVCEAYAEAGAEDITAAGSWRKALLSRS